ncbi:MAG: hypothetical protein IKA25_02400 [Alphaproteobacteria bacterium]|nr:hypothetical protein [Alphaproteobacteria bacterium]MBQ7290035.1 hypothetical protein [Alphaproteobacteria bacterium]MBR1953901.1 hypothetical protein [Alphaproteobacteria bacterium]
MKKKFKNAFKRIRNLIVNPKRYFTKIVADGNMEEAMLKAFLYGLLGGCLVLLIRLLGGATITIGAIFTAIIIVPVLAVALLFVMGGLMMLVSEITGGERDWEIAIKGLASVFFIYPVILVLNAMAFNCTSIWVISMLVDIYVLFLFYNISLYCMRGKRGNVLLVIGVLALFMLTVYATDYRIGWFMLKNTSATLACLL